MGHKQEKTMAQYISLLTSLIGVLGALGGAWVANFFSEKRFTAQAALEKSTQNTKLLTGKGEELYLLLTSWDKSVFNYQAYQLSVVKGELTIAQFNDFLSGFDSKDTHDRLETLLPLYFPELSIHMKELRKHLDLGNKTYRAYENDGLDALVAQKIIYESMINTGKAFKELKNALSARVHEIIK